MKIKDRHVFLVCSECSNRNYTTHKRSKSTYKLEKKKHCRFCGKHTAHKEKKL
jgi:large subunit ribosomal protein L33